MSLNYPYFFAYQHYMLSVILYFALHFFNVQSFDVIGMTGVYSAAGTPSQSISSTAGSASADGVAAAAVGSSSFLGCA